MSGPLGENAVETWRLRQVNARLLFALQIARVALEAALIPEDWAFCPRCQMMVSTIDDDATCAQCKLVL